MDWKKPLCALSAVLLCTAVLMAQEKSKPVIKPDPAQLMNPMKLGRAAGQQSTAAVKKDLTNKDSRGGGDTCETATVIGALPYSDTGTTTGFTNNYDQVCPYTGSTSPDVVYSYAPAADTTVDIKLCNSLYDTKLYVFQDVCSGTALACNDDACGSDGYKSQILGLTLPASHTYFFVVDGYGGSNGTYTIEVTAAQPPPDCPAGSLFGQRPEMTNWSAFTSDPAPGYQCFENFSGLTGPICDLHWWGLNAYADPYLGWIACLKANEAFTITFYADNAGMPGTLSCGPYTVTPTKVDTGLTFGGFPLYYYSVENLAPCCTLTSGWISILGVATGEQCWFLWAGSSIGDIHAWQETLSTGAFADTAMDLSLCLTGVYVPTFGACCNDLTGECTDDVEQINCTGPGMRFVANTLCVDLNPRCGEVVGACCHPDASCDITTQANCADNWLGANTTCAQCPCIVPCPPGGVPESEACGDDTDGGCNMATPTFDPLAIDETICGTIYTTTALRDTDWFQVDTTESKIFTWTVKAEFAVVAGLIEQLVPGVPGCSNITGYINPYALGNPCQEIAVTTACMPPGTYYFFVSAQSFVDMPCGTTNRYTATLTAVTCTVPVGACCLPTGACVPDLNQAECGAQGGIWQGEGVTCDPNPCPQPPDNDTCATAIDVGALPAAVSGDTTAASSDIVTPCGVFDGPWKNVWYTVVGTGNTLTANLCTGTTWDTKISVFCNTCDNLVCITGNDDFCSLQSQVSWCTKAGDVYFITVGGYTASNFGPFTLTVTDDGVPCSNPPCVPFACCVGETCIGDMLQADCTAQGGQWHSGELCSAGFVCPAPQGGDNCSSPFVINLTTLPFVDTNTTCGRLNDYSNTCLGSYDGGEDMIYQLNVPQDVCVSIRLTNTLTWVGIAIDTACPPGASCLAYNTNSSGNPAITNLNLAAGTYYIMIDTWPAPDCTPFTMTISECPQPPPNDNCVDAVELSVPGEVVVDNTAATDDPESTNTCVTGALNQAVWYFVIGDGTTYTATTCNPGGSFSDTKIQVWCGDCSALHCVTGNDDATCSISGLRSTVTWCTLPGAKYLIAIGGYSTNFGIMDLTVASDGVTCSGADEACSTICGDFNGDGVVDVNDFNLFRDAFGTCVGNPKYLPAADFDGDNCITLVDYQAWVQCYRDANPGPLPLWLRMFPGHNDGTPQNTTPSDSKSANSPVAPRHR